MNLRRTILTMPQTRDRGSRARSGLVEAMLLLALFGLYELGRLLAEGQPDTALRHAEDVWALERWLHLPSEQSIQEAVLASGPISVANDFYARVHFPAMVAFLTWAFIRRSDHYRRIRTVLVLLTAAALAIHVGYPLAPPRMLSEYGMIDTAAVYGPSVYGESTIANEFAAMPSLHVGWATLEAWAISRYTRSRWRHVVWLHPLITATVVVVTANHYWLDGVVALLLLFGATAVTDSTGRLRPPQVGNSRDSVPADAEESPETAAYG